MLNSVEHMSILEPSRKDEGVCSLSDVLEVGECRAGILFDSEKPARESSAEQEQGGRSCRNN